MLVQAAEGGSDRFPHARSRDSAVLSGRTSSSAGGRSAGPHHVRGLESSGGQHAPSTRGAPPSARRSAGRCGSALPRRRLEVRSLVYRLHRGFSRLGRLNVAMWTKNARNAISPRSSDAPSATAAHGVQRPYQGRQTGASSSAPDGTMPGANPPNPSGVRRPEKAHRRVALQPRQPPTAGASEQSCLLTLAGSLASLPSLASSSTTERLTHHRGPGTADANSILDRPTARNGCRDGEGAPHV